MSANINFHGTAAIKAEAITHKGSEWLKLLLTDERGQELEITAFCIRKGDAQIYADAINQAHSVVEAPSVEEINEHAANEYVQDNAQFGVGA